MGEALPFGRTVRDLRRALDLTQEELARRVGCAPVTVRKIEYGDLRPSRQIAERLAVALAVPLAEREAFVRTARAVQPAPREPDSEPVLLAEPPTLEALVARGVRGYILDQQLGAGGFGAVYQAMQPAVERAVAIKIILPQHADKPAFIRRFEAEARLVARLEHPHIVPLYDYWRDPGVAFLVMRLLRGGSLQARLGQGALAPTEALKLIEQIGAALTVAHRAGVIHRDLKPANVLLDEEGNAYLADFGIAKDGLTPSGDLSLVGAFVGSPAYSSPEQIRAEPVTPQTDIYALGLFIYEILSGERPFQGPTPVAFIQQQLHNTIPPLAARLGVSPELDQVLQRASAKVPSARYPDVAALLADLQRILAPSVTVPLPRPGSVSSPAATLVLDLDDSDNPYPGLRPFAEDDASAFFGRETTVQQLLARISEPGELSRFLALIGPSGSGKSSLARAGLIPALRNGALPDSDSWYVVDLIPGSDPIAALVDALLRVAPAGVEADDLLPLLRADRRGLLRAARRVLPHDSTSELVLLIDQFEEVFTLLEDEGARMHLLESIVVATLDERSRVRVIITLRADFIDRPLQYVDFGELIKQRGELVLPLTPDELEQAILGPARRSGLALEEGLTAELIGAALGQPGALPLLQHTLSELFTQRRGRLLTLDAYHNLGGVRGALARSAEQIYTDLNTAQQHAARQLFLRLVTPGEGVEDTRRRARRSEFDLPDADRVITAFAAARLLTLDHDPHTREGTVEVAHEALIRSWPRLRNWLDESRDALRRQRQLARMAAEWSAAEYDPSYLPSGVRLEQFAELAHSALVALSADERRYLEAGLAAAAQAQAEAEQRRHERESQRLSAEAALAVEAGDPVLGALLALHVLEQGYNTQADAALVKAMGSYLNWRTLPSAETNIGRGVLLPDGRRLAISSYFGLLVYDLIDERTVLEPDGRGRWIFELCGSPDGRYLAAAEADSTVRLFEAETGALELELAHPAPARGLVYSGDGRQVLTTGTDGFLRRFDVATGALLAAWDFGMALQRVALAPTGDLLAIGTEGGAVILWDLAGECEIRRLTGHIGEVQNVAFSPDGSLLASAGQDNTVRIWDVAAGTGLRVLTGHTELVCAVAFSPDGRFLASGSLDDTARLWHVATGYQLRIGYCTHVGDVCFGKDGTELIAVGRIDSRAWSLDEMFEPHLFLGHTGGAQKPLFALNRGWMITGSTDRTVRIWDQASGRELRCLKHTYGVMSLALSPDERRLLTSGGDSMIRLWDLDHDEIIWEKTGSAEPHLVAFAPDGAKVGICCVTSLEIRASNDGQIIRDFSDSEVNYFDHFCFSPDSRLVAASDHANHTWLIWDITSGELMASLGGTNDPLYDLRFLPDGGHMLVAGTNGTRILEMGSWAERRVIDTAPVTWANISADGRQVALRSADTQFLSFWDLESGRLRRQFKLPVYRTYELSDDGAIIATTEFNGAVRLYRTDLNELMDLARSQLRRGLSAEERTRFGIDSDGNQSGS